MSGKTKKEKVLEAAREFIGVHLVRLETKAKLYGRMVDQLEEVLTEGECFKSKEYEALAMMEYRLIAMTERLKEIMDKQISEKANIKNQ